MITHASKSAAAIVFALFLSAQTAMACSCAQPEGSLESYVASLHARSDVVGIYEVDDFRFTTAELDNEQVRGRWAVIRLRRAFKGDAVELLARAPFRLFGSNCTMRYRRGDLLLVYAETAQAIGMSICSDSGNLLSRLDHVPLLFRLAEDAATTP